VNLPAAKGEEQRRTAEATVGGNQPMSERLLATVAAASLGAHGSPVWSRRAESRLAAREVDAAMDPS
jgi:hypothetical protein